MPGYVWVILGALGVFFLIRRVIFRHSQRWFGQREEERRRDEIAGRHRV